MANFPFFQKTVYFVFGFTNWKSGGVESALFRIYYTWKRRTCQRKTDYPDSKDFQDILGWVRHNNAVPQTKRRKQLWIVMRIRPSNVPYSSAPITVPTRTTALWTGFWLVPTRQIPPWTSAPTASPSARDKENTGGGNRRRNFFLTNGNEEVIL